MPGLNMKYQKTVAIRLAGYYAQQERLLLCLTVRWGSFPINYLGLPLSPGNLVKEDWIPVIEKKMRRNLQFGGNLIFLALINLVLTALPQYVTMSFYYLPEWVVKRIDKLIRAFFWTGTQMLDKLEQCL